MKFAALVCLVVFLAAGKWKSHKESLQKRFQHHGQRHDMLRELKMGIFGVFFTSKTYG